MLLPILILPARFRTHRFRQLAAHTDDDRGLYRPVNQLFKVDLKPEHAEALKFIVNSRSRAWPHGTEVKKREQVVIDISSQILLPLSRANEVIVEKRYRGVKKPDGLRCDYLGLGSMSTWHGTPDMRVRGAEVVVESVDKGDEIDVIV